MNASKILRTETSNQFLLGRMYTLQIEWREDLTVMVTAAKHGKKDDVYRFCIGASSLMSRSLVSITEKYLMLYEIEHSPIIKIGLPCSSQQTIEKL